MTKPQTTPKNLYRGWWLFPITLPMFWVSFIVGWLWLEISGSVSGGYEHAHKKWCDYILKGEP